MVSSLHLRLTVSLLAGWLLLPGCYNDEQLVQEVRNNAIRARLEEVDLGHFRTTLPRDPNSSSRIEVDLELYGTTARYKVAELEEAIEAVQHRLRQALLQAIRQTTVEEMDDPNLKQLRQRLFKVTNAELGETPLNDVGLRLVRFIPM